MTGLNVGVGLLTVVANGFHGAPFLGLLAALLLLRSFGLFKYERVAAVIVALEIVRCGFPAEIAVNALIVHVIAAWDVIGISVYCISHK